MEKTNYINDGFIVKNPDGDEELIHIPYNLNNILISEQDIIQILSQYNVKVECIKRIEYFRQAFTHKSYCKKDIIPSNILEMARNELGNPENLLDLFDKSYERLEYFGDRVLKVIVSMYLFHRYPKQDEGFMTRLQTKLEDKKNLAIMSKEIGLGKFFIISKQIELMNGRNLEKIHEDVFESFVGALFLSNGFEPCMFLIVNLLETLIDYSEKLYCDNNYKDQLLRIHHQNKWTFPQYITIHFEGPPHKRKYIMGVEKQNVSNSDTLLSSYAKHDCNTIQTRCISYGIGSSKKEGEQNAAKMALIIYGVLKQDQYLQSDIYYPPWEKINNFDGESMIIIDPVTENKIIDPVTENKIIEPVTQNKIIEPVTENKIIDPVTENKIIDPVTENKIIDPVTENKIIDPVTENKIIDPVTENKIIEPITENKIIDPVTKKTKKEKPVKPVTEKTKKEKPVKPVTEKTKKEKPVKTKKEKQVKTKKEKPVKTKKEKTVKTEIKDYDSDISIYSDKSI
jgi:dsRNA-specific ribonuclease